MNVPACRILIASGNPDVRDACRDSLQSNGHVLIFACDGKQAIDLFHSDPPDLMLLEPELPLIDGIEVLQRLRRSESSTISLVPILALLCQSNAALAMECLANGADEVVELPVSRVHLNARLRLLTQLRARLNRAEREAEQLRQALSLVEEERDQVELLLTRLVDTGNDVLPNLDCMASPKAYANGDLLLTALAPDASQYVLLGDFSGHGLTAALGVLPAAETFYSMARKGLALEQLASELNHKLCCRLPVNFFMAVCLFRLSPDLRQLEVINAGMPPPRLLQSGKGIVQQLPSMIPALGILSGEAFKAPSSRLEVDPSFTLYAFSDGLVESVTWSDEQLGESRLDRFLEQDDRQRGDLQALYDYLLEFRQGRPQQDDVTLMRYAFAAPALRRGVTGHSA